MTPTPTKEKEQNRKNNRETNREHSPNTNNANHGGHTNKKANRHNENENTKPDLVRELFLRMGCRCLGQTGKRLPDAEQQKHRETIQSFVTNRNLEGGIEYVENIDFTYILF